jgi:hypothetical protein
MNTLHLNLKKQFFNDIALGIKTEEYRIVKNYWTKRLLLGTYNDESINMYILPKHFDEIYFKNGYQKNAPSMRVQCLGISMREIMFPVTNTSELCFVIHLGKILEIKNWKK